MKFTAIDKVTRKVMFAGTSDDVSGLYNDFDILEDVEYYGDGWVDIDNNFIPLPDRPSIYHEFDYITKQWIDPRTAETEWPLVRAKRNQLLAQSDWTQLPDVPISTKEAWAIYRQALRDVTLQPDPFNITWPVPPQET